MKRFIALLSLLLLLLVASDALAVGSCYYYGGYSSGGKIRHWWKVTTDANGDMTETSCGGTTMNGITGWLTQVEFWPDTTSPWTDGTADIQLRGANTVVGKLPAFNTDYDYARGKGANLASSTSDGDNIRGPTTSDSTYIWLHSVKIVPWVDEGGNAKTGVVFIIVKPE